MIVLFDATPKIMPVLDQLFDQLGRMESLHEQISQTPSSSLLQAELVECIHECYFLLFEFFLVMHFSEQITSKQVTMDELGLAQEHETSVYYASQTLEKQLQLDQLAKRCNDILDITDAYAQLYSKKLFKIYSKNPFRNEDLDWVISKISQSVHEKHKGLGTNIELNLDYAKVFFMSAIMVFQPLDLHTLVEIIARCPKIIHESETIAAMIKYFSRFLIELASPKDTFLLLSPVEQEHYLTQRLQAVLISYGEQEQNTLLQKITLLENILQLLFQVQAKLSFLDAKQVNELMLTIHPLSIAREGGIDDMVRLLQKVFGLCLGIYKGMLHIKHTELSPVVVFKHSDRSGLTPALTLESLPNKPTKVGP